MRTRIEASRRFQPEPVCAFPPWRFFVQHDLGLSQLAVFSWHCVPFPQALLSCQRDPTENLTYARHPSFLFSGHFPVQPTHSIKQISPIVLRG